jgi:hypothetical protein
MARKVFRVVPNGTHWQVKHNGGVLTNHYTKQAAVAKGVHTRSPTNQASLWYTNLMVRLSTSTLTATTRSPQQANTHGEKRDSNFSAAKKSTVQSVDFHINSWLGRRDLNLTLYHTDMLLLSKRKALGPGLHPWSVLLPNGSTDGTRFGSRGISVVRQPSYRAPA